MGKIPDILGRFHLICLREEAVSPPQADRTLEGQGASEGSRRLAIQKMVNLAVQLR
jgi:hypothetical protein